MRLSRLFAVLVLLLDAAVALAADVPIVGLKLIVIDKGGGGAAKTVFVAKDVAITKGAATDPTQIEATFEVAYDGASGGFLMPQGGKWTSNKATAAKYGNKTAPSGGVVKVGLIKPGSLLKVVGRGLGDTPLDIASAPSGDVYVAATIVNGGETTRLCTRFSGCVHKSIAGGTGYKLLCKGNSAGDPSCIGATEPCASAPVAPVGGAYATCTTAIPSGQTCALTCADGYTHAGTDPVCVDGAFTGDATCMPATCAPLAEANVTSDCGTASTGSACTLQCAAGTHRTDGGMESSVTGTCTGVGPGASAWAHPTFTCGPDPCPSAPVPPAGGSYLACAAPPIASGTTCVLSCANGYSATGANPTCSFGQFDGAAPTCVAATCAPLNEANIASDCGTAATGSACTIHCPPGYHRSDGGSGSTAGAMCTGTGPGTSVWTHPTFTCEANQCIGPPAPIPTGGSFPTCSGLVPSGTTCPLACANGYSHTGSDPSCYLGFFNGSTADCVPATCAAIAPLPLDTPPYTQTNCGAATTGATCTVQCQAGNIRNDGGGPPNSSVTATCIGTGPGTSQWTYPTFTCIGQPCMTPPNPPPGGSFPTCTTAPIASKTDCFVECANGYTAPDNRITCYLGSYNGTAHCSDTLGAIDMPMTGICADRACGVVAPAGALALDGAAGLNAATLLSTAIAALQLIRRRRRR